MISDPAAKKLPIHRVHILRCLSMTPKKMNLFVFMFLNTKTHIKISEQIYSDIN